LWRYCSHRGHQYDLDAGPARRLGGPESTGGRKGSHQKGRTEVFMKSLQRKNVLLFTFILAAVGATPVLGQKRVERADALLLRAKAAEELASHSANAEARADAARLHLESARLRPESDLQGIASLWTAGLYYAYEQPAEAARLIATAADRAHAMGDIV